jgi:putative transposase
MILSHQIALDLTEAQQQYCARAAGTARSTYNWALAEWQRQYQEGGKPTAAALKKQWNQVKHEHYPWVTEIHKDANQQPFANLGNAFTQFFRKEAAYPTFKKKGVHDAFYISNDKCAVRGTRFCIPRLGWVRMREALRFTGNLLSAVVSRIADRWFVSFAVRLDDTPRTCESQACVGIDLGVLTLATLSTGEKIEGPKPLRTLLKKLRRLSKRVSRTVQGSRNRVKVQSKLARLHYRMQCQRKDSLHKLTTDLTTRFGTIVIEDLHVKGMVRNHHLAHAISDMGFGTFGRLLDYKAAYAGCQVVVADRWFPSSKRCAQCGVVAEELPLAQRVFHCPCGYTADRDVNAALNLARYPRLVGK